MTEKETTILAAADLAHLKTDVHGEVVLPSDDTYDAVRQMHNPLQAGRPAVIVRPIDADDVVCAVRFAVDQGLAIAVRGGGHSGAGFGTVNDGIVIDLRLMRTITIDPESRIARVEGGVTAGELTNATIAHGLIVPFGDSPKVGVGGITTGGGVGWLTRKLGMTIDSLLAAEMVTADGRKLRVSETENPDLFWAIRGGGGNFGVVTLFEFRLHPIKTVLGGTLYLPPTREAIRGVLELSQQAPDELTTISMIAYMMPAPGVPEALHGQLTLMVNPVWVGDLVEGQHVLDAFRALGTPMIDEIRPMPFNEMYEMNGEIPEQYTAISRSFMGHSLDDAAIDALIAGLQKPQLPSASSMVAVQFRVLGGAMARVPADATAFAHRDANLLIAIAAIGFEQNEHDLHQKWVEDLFEAVQPESGVPYLNFLELEGEARLRKAYPVSTYARLAEIKRRYDPQNLFHRNHNIQPASARAQK